MLLPLRIKMHKAYRQICQFFICAYHSLCKVFRKERVFFLIGTPEHGNLGDQLIALGELKWLADYYPHVRVLEFTHEELMADHRCRALLSQIRKEDVLFLHGGGNLNDKYVNCETIRRIVIRKCRKNKIILFPQSVSYADTDEAERFKAETARIYNTHPDLTVIAREQTSFLNAREMFPALRVEQSPDMATYLFRAMRPSADFPRSGIAMCIRRDGEIYYSRNEMKRVATVLASNYSIDWTDTHVRHRVISTQRRAEAQALIDALAQKKVVITDRFHGVIFSILARTPCVVLRSCDHKIVDGVKWFADLPGVFYADSLQDVPALVERAFATDAQEPPDFSAYFAHLYDLLDLNLS